MLGHSTPSNDSNDILQCLFHPLLDILEIQDIIQNCFGKTCSGSLLGGACFEALMVSRVAISTAWLLWCKAFHLLLHFGLADSSPLPQVRRPSYPKKNKNRWLRLKDPKKNKKSAYRIICSYKLYTWVLHFETYCITVEPYCIIFAAPGLEHRGNHGGSDAANENKDHNVLSATAAASQSGEIS